MSEPPANSISMQPPVQMNSFVRQSSRDRILKRALDISGAALLIAILAPLFATIALLIFVANGRPVLYRRRVLGRNGEFDAFKFRTMRPDADRVLQANARLREEFVRNFKLQSDPRITNVGAILRKFSLDELPQLFNVLRGQMSLVGPRMITAPELAKYTPHENLLLTVKPGLTGYWQVHGRQDVSYEERVRMDLFYIQRRSLSLDLAILFRTPARVLRGKGAY
jgi:lipopolysaccharide/colanic/teichoic acid biosynthesis glycosyltransferase